VVKNKKWVVPAAAAAIVLLAFAVSFLLEWVAWQGHSKRISQLQENDRQASSKLFFEDRQVKDFIEYDDVKHYIEIVTGQEVEYRQHIKALKSGLYLPSPFKAKRVALEQGVRNHQLDVSPLLQAAQAALSVVNDAAERADQADLRAQTVLKSVRSEINPQADLSDIATSLETLNRGISEMTGVLQEIEHGRVDMDDTGPSYEIAMGVLAQCYSKVYYQYAYAQLLRQAVKQNALCLRNYKDRMSCVTQAEVGGLVGMNRFVNLYAPTIRNAGTQVSTLQDAITRLEKPLPIIRKSSLDLLCDLDATQQTRAAVQAIKLLCQGVVKLDREVSQFKSKTDPVLNAVKLYNASKTRNAMLAVYKVAPETRSYFNDNLGVFEAPLQQLRACDKTLAKMQRTVNRIRNPLARPVCNGFIHSAATLVNGLKSPLRSGASSFEAIIASMENVEQLEEKYKTDIKYLVDASQVEFAQFVNLHEGHFEPENFPLELGEAVQPVGSIQLASHEEQVQTSVQESSGRIKSDFVNNGLSAAFYISIGNFIDTVSTERMERRYEKLRKRFEFFRLKGTIGGCECIVLALGQFQTSDEAVRQLQDLKGEIPHGAYIVRRTRSMKQ